MRKVALASLLAAGLLAGVFAGPTAIAGDKDAKAKIGQPAPELSLPDQNGKTVSLADHKGKIVVLEWFNPGCPYVQKFYAHGGQMNEFAKQLASKDVVWLAINSNKNASADANKSQAGKWQIDRPVLADPDAKVAKAYGAKTTPHMYVIDAEGKLAYMGAIDDKPDSETSSIDGAKNYVLAAVSELQAGKPVSTPETKSYGCSVKY